MDFTSLKFLVFLAAVALIYRLAPARLRALLLLVASYGFYWTWSDAMALLMFGVTVAAYVAGRAIGAADGVAKRSIAFGAVAVLVGLLALFKSAPFWQDLAGHSLLMPLGISYYTFKLISYVVDVYWEKRAAEKPFIPFAAYVAFFPQILAGPIQRSESLLLEIHRASPAQFGQVPLGTQRIMLGFFKKLVVADNLQILVNFVYSHLHAHGTPLLLGFYAYPLEIYADFSGLTDIAIGSALLFGIESPENFMAPFAAPTISEYWRRWHITLTGWVTDYVFTPLRVATREFGNGGLIFSLLANMVLIGIWHRLVWQFVLFGVLHAIYLAVDALTVKSRKRFYKSNAGAKKFMTAAGPVFVFQLVAIGMVFFRSERVSDIFYFLGHLFSGIGQPSREFAALMDVSGRNILVGFGGYAVIEVADYFRRHNEQGQLTRALPEWGRWSVYSCTAVTATLLLLLLLAFGSANRNPFLYAIF